MRKTILQIMCLIVLAAFLLTGCSKDKPETTDPSVTAPGSDTAEATVVLLEMEEKTLSGTMEAIMKDGSEADSYGGDTTLNGGGEFSFMTTKTISDGRVVIMGSVFYGPESDLLDLDVEAYYTDEDLEKLGEDPDYQPEVVLPSYTEILLGDIDSSARTEQTAANLTVTCGSKTWSASGENRAYYEFRACGADGQNILCITVSADALGCTDPDAALSQADALVQSWLASLQLSAASNS